MFPHAAALAALLVLGGSAGETLENGAAAGGPRTVSLEEALRLLDSQSPALAQVKSRVEEARAVARQAAAPLLPSVALSGSYVRNHDSAEIALGELFTALEKGLSQATGRPVSFERSPLPESTVIQPLEAFSAAAALRVPLFAPGSYLALTAARSAADSAQASSDAHRQQLWAALVQAAWWAQATEQVVEASVQAVAAAREHHQSALHLVQAGLTAPRLAELQAETELVRREGDLVNARSARDRAWLAVGVLLGQSEPVRVLLGEASATAPGPVDELLASALASRAELRAREAAVEAARRQLDSAWWRLAPQLSAGASAFASSVAFPTGDKAGWRASVDLSWAVFDGGFRSAKRRQAEAALAGAEAALRAARIAVSQEVLDAVRELELARERLRLGLRQAELAKEAYASARRSYEAGLVGSLDALDANLRTYQAAVGLAEAKARVGVASAALERAVGRWPQAHR